MLLLSTSQSSTNIIHLFPILRLETNKVKNSTLLFSHDFDTVRCSVYFTPRKSLIFSLQWRDALLIIPLEKINVEIVDYGTEALT